MGQIIYIITDPSVGGTFLNWSLHFLAGHTWYQTTQGQQPLTANPLNKNNAHCFLPNQPLTVDKFYQTVNKLKENEYNQFSTVYFHNFTNDLFNKSGSNTRAIDYVKQSTSKIIRLSLDSKDCLYHCHYASRAPTHKFNDSDIFLTDSDSSHAEYVEHFHATDVRQFKSIWEHRDFLAVRSRPFDPVTITNSSNFSFDHYYLNALDLFTTFSSTLYELFDYLEIKIDQDRLDQWVTIYHSWQKIVNQRLIFSHYFDEIVINILAGKHMDLVRFNLDIVQESALQHILLYQFRRSLQSKNLINFVSTQQLHKLLCNDVSDIKSYWPRPHLIKNLKNS